MQSLRTLIRRSNPSDLWARWRSRPLVDESLFAPGKPSRVGPGLETLAAQHQGMQFVKWWHYFDVYERHLGQLAAASRVGWGSQSIRILEVGVLDGGSLELWAQWFGASATIFGIDVDPRCGELKPAGAQIRIGSQEDPVFLRGVVEEMGGLDVVIDDGNHTSRSVKATLGILFPLLRPGGTYLIEDLHASYWPSFGGGLRRKGSSIEALKAMVDLLHQPYVGVRVPNDLIAVPADQLKCVTFYDSIAILEKQSKRSTFLFRSSTDVDS